MPQGMSEGNRRETDAAFGDRCRLNVSEASPPAAAALRARSPKVDVATPAPP